MKQMDECLTRALAGKPLLPSKKWKAIIAMRADGPTLFLFHYHHRVLVYSLDRNEVLYEWWEKPTDKRGLDSAKEWLDCRSFRLAPGDS